MKIDPDRVQGNFIGIMALIMALMFFAVAVIDGEHWWKLAWIGAVSGWGLTGLFSMKVGEERAARNTADEEYCGHDLGPSMPLKLPEPCPHDVAEQDVAAQAYGLCPLCLAADNAKLRAALQKIADLPPPEKAVRPVKSHRRIAIRALQQS